MKARGTHFREDYPYRDDIECLKWITISRGRGDEINLRQEPVPLETYPIKPAERKRIPHPVQHSLKEEKSDH